VPHEPDQQHKMWQQYAANGHGSQVVAVRISANLGAHDNRILKELGINAKHVFFCGRDRCSLHEATTCLLHTVKQNICSVDSLPPENRVVLGRPLDPVLDLGGQRGRDGLGHSAPTLIDLDPQQFKSAAQVSSGSLLSPAAASMQATDGPSTSACNSGRRPSDFDSCWAYAC